MTLQEELVLECAFYRKPKAPENQGIRDGMLCACGISDILNVRMAELPERARFTCSTEKIDDAIKLYIDLFDKGSLFGRYGFSADKMSYPLGHFSHDYLIKNFDKKAGCETFPIWLKVDSLGEPKEITKATISEETF